MRRSESRAEQSRSNQIRGEIDSEVDVPLKPAVSHETVLMSDDPWPRASARVSLYSLRCRYCRQKRVYATSRVVPPCLYAFWSYATNPGLTCRPPAARPGPTAMQSSGWRRRNNLDIRHVQGEVDAFYQRYQASSSSFSEGRGADGSSFAGFGGGGGSSSASGGGGGGGW